MSKHHNRFSYSYDEPKEEKILVEINDESPLVEENEVATVQEVEEEKLPDVSPVEPEVKVENKRNSFVGKTTVLCNMRKGPTMTSDVLTVLSEGTQVEVDENPGAFYKVKLGNSTGYILKELIKR